MEIQKETLKTLSIVIRYAILLIVGSFNLIIFYKIFTPLTIYPTYFLFNAFFPNSLIVGETIYFKTIALLIAPSCVAGSAYFLLTILNLTTPMSFLKRILSLAFSYIIFLTANILRIFIFALFFIWSFSVYKFTHFIFWYIISTIIVFFSWYFTIKFFSVEKIPFYSDFKFLHSLSKKKSKH